jgi:hypothetical protein
MAKIIIDEDEYNQLKQAATRSSNRELVWRMPRGSEHSAGKYENAPCTLGYYEGKVKSCHLPYDHPFYYDGGDGEGGDG